MSLWAWGTNSWGQLGNNTRVDQLEPVVLEHLKGVKIRDVSSGDFHSCAIAESGDLYSWGRSKEGQIGTGEHQSSKDKIDLREIELIPRRLWSLDEYRIIQVACGTYHTIALTSEGEIFLWGRLFRYSEKAKDNDEARSAAWSYLMHGGYSARNLHKSIIDKSEARYNAGKMGKMPSNVQNGWTYSGFNSGMDPNPVDIEPYLQEIPAKTVLPDEAGKVKTVAAGYGFSVMVTYNGEVYSMGVNDKFQLGVGHRHTLPFPTRVQFLNPTPICIVSAACGEQHTLLLSEDGRVYSFGLGVFGQLGHFSTKDEAVPRVIEALLGHYIVQIACGSHHSLALEDNGTVWVWGNKEFGQHGGATEHQDWGGSNRHSALHAKPHIVEGLPHNIVKISCGSLFNVVVDSNFVVYSWGWGSSGALGLGNRRYRLQPSPVVRLSGERISEISAGARHVLAINGAENASFAFDYKSVLLNPVFADVAFLVQGRWISAHKVMIFARCMRLSSIIVLTEKYSSNTREQIHGALDTPPEGCLLVHIPKMRYASFKALLLYLYTDHLQLPSHFAPELREVAVSYGLPRLAAMCDRLILPPVSSTEMIRLPDSTFKTDLEEAMDDERNSDLSLVVSNGDSFLNMKVHKAILTARSDYFRAEFFSEFREKTQSIIEIQDVDVDSFKLGLRYIYTGDESVVQPPLPDSRQSDDVQFNDGIMQEIVDALGISLENAVISAVLERAFKKNHIALSQNDVEIQNADQAENTTIIPLLKTADRFMLFELKQLCEDLVEASLDCDNVLYLLEIADTYGAGRLKHACMIMIKDLWVSESLQADPALGILLQSSPNLLREIEFRLVRECGIEQGEVIRIAQRHIVS